MADDKDKTEIDKALDVLTAPVQPAPKTLSKAAAKAVAPAVKPERAAPPFELTAEEKAAIEKEAAEEVALELKEQKRADYKAQAKSKLKKQELFRHGRDDEGEETEPVTINLASHSPYIRLDSAVYYHGMTYRLNRAKAQVIKDVMHRTWLHDAEINGLDMNQFMGRQKYASVISPANLH